MLDDLIDVKPAEPEVVAATARVAVQGIAVVGSHPGTRMDAPYGDPSWRIWACSPGNSPFGIDKGSSALPRVDEHFELHAPIEHPTRPYAYLRWLSERPQKVWMRDARAMASGMFPNAVPYPEKELYGTDVLGKSLEMVAPGRAVEAIRAYPVGNGLFNPWAFTSSVAYMLAKAVVDCEREKIPAIGLWGILQSSENEYAYQRQGTQYFLWEAARRGIKVVVAPESRLAERPADNW